MKTAIITQARMSSIRLPGKVLAKINNQPILEYHLKRAQESKIPIIVATSIDRKDDAIVQLCQTISVPVFRGDLNDVLARFYYCAQAFDLTTIIRITSDCPLIDGDLIAKGLRMFQKSGCDYLSNTVKRTYPRGFDFEIFTFAALTEAFQKATELLDREHVTPYIWRNHPDRFIIKQLTQPKDESAYRITVDTQEDFLAVKTLIQKYQAHKKNSLEIIELLEKHPKIAKLNADVQQKHYGQ